MAQPDDLTLVVGDGGRALSGWTDLTVTRGIEECPPHFELGITERFPDEAQAFVVQPGDACSVRLGSDVVITGFVDLLMPTIDERGHAIRVSGRGKCQDLVDCAAKWDAGLLTNNSVFQIATKLADYYGVKVVKVGSAKIGDPITQLMIIVTETPWDIIERVCRSRALLAYELPDGSLALANVGSEKAAGALVQGVNVKRAQARLSLHQRFGVYEAHLLSVDSFSDVSGGPLAILDRQVDTGVPSQRAKRTHSIIAELSGGGAGLAIVKQRNVWEMNRRRGRSFQLLVTVAGWRDSAGALWTPNTLVSVSIPDVKVDGVEWLLSRVTYHRSAERGTVADLELMPAEAFSPEPIILQPLPLDVGLSFQQQPVPPS